MTRKTPLILLAGLLCDHTVWETIAAELADLAEATLLDFRGFDSIGRMADKVLHEAPAAFTLIGHSMGGRVALEAFKKAPHRITRLGLFNTGVHPKRVGEDAGRQKLLDLADSVGMQAVAKAWLPPMMAQASLQNPDLMGRLQSMVVRYTPTEFHQQIQALLDRPNAEQVLPLISVPTLLLSGTEDQWSPLAQHQAMQLEIAHSLLVAIPEAGHMAPVEQPLLVAAHLRHWLTDT